MRALLQIFAQPTGNLISNKKSLVKYIYLITMNIIRNLTLFLLHILLFTSSSCSASKEQVVLFDSSQGGNTDSISSLFGGIYKFEDNALKVHSGVTSKYSGVKLTGEWDLSECNKLLLTVTNYNTKEYLPITIHLEGKGASLSKQQNIFLERAYIPAGETKTVVIDLPSVLPNPEVKELCTKMRRDPFYQWGTISTLDPKDTVVAVCVYVNRPRENWDWALNNVSAEKGEPNKPYAWMQYTKDEFFPFIDKYGQFKHNDWEGKTHSDNDLTQAYKDELKDWDAHSGPKGRNKYGSWMNGPKLDGTGNFRVEKYEGKWWIVDPEGYLFWSHGVVRVTPSSAITPLDKRDFYFEGLPKEGDEYAEFYHTYDTLLQPYYVARNIQNTYDFSAANIKRKYGDDWRQTYADMSHRRLKSWGLNTIANSSDRSIALMRLTPYIDRFELKSPELEASEGVWWKFRDPFHPEFKTNFNKQLLERKHELDDPWCVGFFVDNEIDWGESYTLGEWTMQCSEKQPAKQEMIEMLKAKYKTIESLNNAWKTAYPSWDELLKSTKKPPLSAQTDCTDFSAIMTEAYFKNVRDEFKKVAPHKLYMGCRFARSNENVLRIGAKYCDVISYNIYKIDLNGFSLPEGIDKPVMIGEFHFGALDRGMFHPGLVKTADQKERAMRYSGYVESALRHPNIIGTHWHQLSDQATTGRFDGENFQVGFVDVCDRPYKETIEKIREVGYRMYDIRSEK